MICSVVTLELTYRLKWDYTILFWRWSYLPFSHLEIVFRVGSRTPYVVWAAENNMVIILSVLDEIILDM